MRVVECYRRVDDGLRLMRGRLRLTARHDQMIKCRKVFVDAGGHSTVGSLRRDDVSAHHADDRTRDGFVESNKGERPVVEAQEGVDNRELDREKDGGFSNNQNHS